MLNMNTNRWVRLFSWQRMNKNGKEEENKVQEPKEKKKEETTKLK